METQTIEVPVRLAGLYDSSPNPFREGVIIEGFNCIPRGTDNIFESWNGLGPTVVNLGTGFAVLEVVGTATGNTYGKVGGATKPGIGDIAGWQNNSAFYIGEGGVYLGSGVPFDTASQVLKVRLSSGAIFTVGMAKPLAPVISQAAAASLKGLLGTRAARVSEVNLDTGWESNASEPSNVATFLNKQMDMEFKPVANGVKTDGWYRYITPAGLGGLGQVAPFYRLGGLVPISGPGSPTGGHLIFDFNDTELLPGFPAPVEFDTPPGFPGGTLASSGGFWVICFDAYVVILGSYGGSGISPSEPNNSGSYDPLNTVFPYTVEKINAVWPRAAAGYALFSSKSALSALYPVGGRPGVAVRPLWDNDGIPAGHKGGKFAKGIFFAYTGSGPAYLEPGAPPQIAMSQPVRDEMRRNFDPSTVCVGYDPRDEMVCYAGQMQTGPLAGQWVAFPYRIGVGWGPKLVLDGQPQDAITVETSALDGGPRLHFLIGGALKKWDTQGGSGLVQGWLLRSGAMQIETPEHFHTIRRMVTSANSANINVKVYVNLQDGAGQQVFAYPAAGGPGNSHFHGKVKRCRVARAKSVEVEYSGTLPNQIVDQTTLLVEIDPRLVASG